MNWVVYKHQTFIFHTSGGWKSRIKMLAYVVSGEDFLLGSETAISSLCPHIAEGSLSGLFCKDTNRIHGVPLSGLNHLPKAPPLNTITLGVRLQHMNFRGTQTFGL